jgi:hypothetical protein
MRVVWVTALMLALVGCTPEPQRPVALTGATLLDGTAAPPRRNMTIVLRRFKVDAIGPTGELAPPDGAQVVNVHGDFVLPLTPETPLTVGGPADLLITPANPALDSDYLKRSWGRMQGGIWTQRPR